MDTKSDFFQRKLSNTRSFVRQKRTSKIWLIISIIVLLAVLSVIWWKIFRAPVDLDAVETVNQNLSLDQEVYLEWELKADWDFTTHTHTINDSKYGLIWLKSSELNLSDYVGFVQLTWKVEKYNQQEMRIVRVNQISWTIVNDDEDTDIVLDENSGVYIMGAWIQFLPSFFDEYVLLNEWENGEIQIQNVESWEKIAINYFRCNASDPNRNCKWLSETFANTSAQSFVTSEGDVYYKQSEVQSWFVANGEWRGIFINDVSDDVVFQLKDLMKFANENNIKEWIKNRAVKLCQWSWEKMQEIVDSEISLKQEWLVVSISWHWKEKEMSCKILVDFSLPTKWVLQDLVIWENFETRSMEEQQDIMEEQLREPEQSSNNEVVIASEWNPDVSQFPIKADWLVYSSNRWYRLQFPSSNISYVASIVKENFGQNNISCSYVINVIKYSEKENLETNPAVRIYECTAWWNVAPWADNYVVYNVLDKSFIVQINDSSWINFSKNLKFDAL